MKLDACCAVAEKYLGGVSFGHATAVIERLQFHIPLPLRFHRILKRVSKGELIRDLLLPTGELEDR